jgi:hypothetical protein
MSEPQRMESSAEAQPSGGGDEIDAEWWLRFLAHWLDTTPPDQWEGDRWFDTVKKLLLSDQPESQYFRFLIVNELEELRQRRWCNAYKNNGTLARLKDLELRALIAEKRRLRVKTPVKEALAEVAKRWGHLSGPALNRWLRRNRPRTEQT